MRVLKNSARYFRSYFRLSEADSSRLWQGMGAEARYGYLAALLQWQIGGGGQAEPPGEENTGGRK